MPPRAPSSRTLERESAPSRIDRILLVLVTLAIVALFWRIYRDRQLDRVPAPPPAHMSAEDRANLEQLKHLDKQRRDREERRKWRVP